MKKLPFAALLGAVFLSGAVNATDLPYGHDSDPDACGAVLCLLGMT